jgi:hypothetical protein
MNNISTWDDVFSVRTTPQPTPVSVKSDWIVGDKRYGMVDGEERFTFPTLAEKGAMTNASSPSSANPFAVVDETTNMLIAEPQAVQYTSLSSVTFIEIPDTERVYIGKNTWDGPGTVARFFDVCLLQSVSLTPRVPLLGSDAGRISVGNIAHYGTSNPVDPPNDADANGFIDGARVYLNFDDTEDTNFTGSLILRYGRGKKLKELEQTFVESLSTRECVHAADVSAKGLQSPTFGTNEKNLQEQLDVITARISGPASRYVDLEEFAMKNTRGNQLSQTYQANNISVFAASGKEYRMIGAGFVRQSTGGYYHNQRSLFYIEDKTYLTRSDITNPNGNRTLGARVDVASNLYDAVVAGEGSSGTWKIQDACMDDTYVYLRASESTGSLRHCVYVVDIYYLSEFLEVDVWGSKPYVMLDGTGTATFDEYWAYSIIHATDTYIATNNPQTISTASSSTKCIQLINRSTGVISDSGQGNALTGYYPLGPLASDGNKVVWAAANNPITAKRVFACQISDLTSGGFTTTILETDTDDTIITSIKYDGENFWICTTTKIIVFSSYDAIQTKIRKNFADPDTLSDRAFGFLEFDGQNIWVTIYWNDSDDRKLVGVACLPAEQSWNCNAEGSGTIIEEDFLPLMHMSASLLRVGEISAYDFTYNQGVLRDQIREVVFDGVDLWVNMGGGTSYHNYGKRLPNVRDRR